MSYGLAGSSSVFTRIVPPSWQASVVYAVGDLVENDSGNVYICITAGTSNSSGGPTGTTNPITDNTVSWNYVRNPGDAGTLSRSYEFPISFCVSYKVETSDFGISDISPPVYTWPVAFDYLFVFGAEGNGPASSGTNQITWNIQSVATPGYYNYARAWDTAGSWDGTQIDWSATNAEVLYDRVDNRWITVVGIWDGSGVTCTKITSYHDRLGGPFGQNELVYDTSPQFTGTISRAMQNRLAFAVLGQHTGFGGGVGGTAGGGKQYVKVANWGLWNRALTADEATAIITGANPVAVQPNDLILYAPLKKDKKIIAGHLVGQELSTNSSPNQAVLFSEDNPEVEGTTITPILYEYADAGQTAKVIATGEPVTIDAVDGEWLEIPFDVSVDPNKTYWVGAKAQGIPLALPRESYSGSDIDAVITDREVVDPLVSAHSGMFFTFEASATETDAPFVITHRNRAPRFFGNGPMIAPFPNLTYPLSLACWWDRHVIDSTHTMIQLTGSGGTDYNTIETSTGENIVARSRSAAGGFNATTTTSHETHKPTRWHHAAGVFASSISRFAWLDGGGKSTENTSEAVIVNRDTISIGGNADSSPDNYWQGHIIHAAVWNAALTDGEVYALSRGARPTEIQPTKLVAYYPLTHNLACLITGRVLRPASFGTAPFPAMGDVASLPIPDYYPKRTYFLPLEVKPNIENHFMADFADDPVNSGAPAGWDIVTSTEDWDVVSDGTASNGKALRYNGSGSGYSTIVWRAASEYYNRKDFEILARHRSPVTSPSCQIGGRLVWGLNAGTPDRQECVFGDIGDTGPLTRILWVDNYSTGSLNGSADISTQGTYFYGRFRVEGTTAYYKNWEGTLADEPATWSVTKTSLPTGISWGDIFIGGWDNGDTYLDWITVAYEGETALSRDQYLARAALQQPGEVLQTKLINKKPKRYRSITFIGAPLANPQQWIELPTGINLPYNNTEMSVMAWIKWTKAPSTAPTEDYRIIAKSVDTGTADHSWMLGYSGASDVMRCRFAMSTVTCNGSLTMDSIWSNGWMLAGATYNSGSAQMWINGAADGSPVSLSGTTMPYNQHPAYFAQSTPPLTTTNRAPPAKVAHVALFNRALSSTEWLALYRGKNPMTIPQIINYWPITGQPIEPDLVRGAHGRVVNKSSTNLLLFSDDVPKVDLPPSSENILSKFYTFTPTVITEAPGWSLYYRSLTST